MPFVFKLDFGNLSIGPLDPISMVGIGVGLPLLFAREIKEEFFPYNLKFLGNTIVKWTFYIIVACYTLAMGVLDAGQFIYVTF